MKWKNRKRSLLERERTTIGIIGVCPGVGVTHLAFCLSQFLDKIAGQHTALVEYNRNGDFYHFQSCYFEEESEIKESFQLGGINCYPSVNTAVYMNILNKNYSNIIVDFGSNRIYAFSEFLRCDKKIVVANLSEWRQESLIQFINESREIIGSKDWNYIIPFTTDAQLKKSRRIFGRKLTRFPYQPDLSLFGKEQIEFFHTIL